MKDDMKDDDSRDSMADDDKKSDRSLMKDQSMDKKSMTNDTMKTKLNLETIVKHLMSSNSTCPAALMTEDKMALCKRAALAWRCVEMLIKKMPSNVRELAMGTMKMVKMAVEEKCHGRFKKHILSNMYLRNSKVSSDNLNIKKYEFSLSLKQSEHESVVSKY